MELGSPNRSLNEFIDRGLKSVGPERYFRYDSKAANWCQYFIKWNLSANGLWTDAANKFVMQDSVAIYKNLGLLDLLSTFERANKVVTDIASKVDSAIYGAGRKKKKRIVKR